MAGSAEGPVAARRPGATSFEELSAEEHRILAYASAIGSEFDFDLLVGAMGTDEELLAERLERLVHAGVLRERPGGDRFGFVEEEFRARVYRSLTESRLRVLHRKIAEVLERMHPQPSAEILRELGRHYFLGKVPEKSYRYNRQAAEEARAAEEPEVATHHLQRVLVDLAALGGERRREEVDVAESLGDLYFSIGDYAAADRYYAEALDRIGVEEPRVRGRLRLARAEVAREQLNVQEATQGAVEARHLFESAEDPLGVAQTYRLLGRIAFQRGAYRDALEENMRALDLLGPTADPRLLGRLSIDIGNSFALLGPEVRSVAVEWYERAIDRLRQAADWPELSRAYHNLGVAVGELQPQDGLDYLEKAQEAGERAHDPRSTGRSLLSGVELRLALGQLDEAERDNEQAGRLLGRLTDDLGLQLVEVNRGQIDERRGQWEDAERAYERAADICRRFHLPADEAEVEFHLARLRFKTRDLEGARRALRLAADLGLTELRPTLAPAFDDLKRQLDRAGPEDSAEAPGSLRPADPRPGREL
ncbi:MAG TPA: tetratricopeptide repeat protein [Thermoplasmata archaeon]|nr:tetratricopeptide repeat protein [Thermoplasmata archaeon]